MIDCEYYKNYKGPELKLVQIWKNKEEKKDITEDIKIFYGENNRHDLTRIYICHLLFLFLY